MKSSTTRNSPVVALLLLLSACTVRVESDQPRPQPAAPLGIPCRVIKGWAGNPPGTPPDYTEVVLSCPFSRGYQPVTVRVIPDDGK